MKQRTINAMIVLTLIAIAIPTLNSLGVEAVEHLRCENQENPLGIESAAPRLSWQIASDERGIRQAAYRVLVASSAELLTQGAGDLWDSGMVESDQSHLIAYAGKPLASHQHYFWKVGVGLAGRSEVVWSSAATWSMGFLSPAEWQAHWIAMPSKTAGNKELEPSGAKWIWSLPTGATALEVPPGPCRLARRFKLPEGAVIVDAQLMVSADNSAEVNLNGKAATKVSNWENGKIISVKELLVAGENELEVLAMNGGNAPNPAGMICKLRIGLGDGAQIEIVSDGQWSAGINAESGRPNPVSEIAPWGDEPWGTQLRFEESSRAGLPIFRKSFVTEGTVKRALVDVSGLGQYELFLNGQKVGQQFLAPAWSVYERTVYYNSFDITTLLKPGANEFRIMLGKGFYNTHGDRRVHGVDNRGELMAILEGRIEYADGRVELVRTDDTWDAATGPITHCAILAGSDFDARAAEPKEWVKAAQVSCPGTLRTAESPAMECFERLLPVKAPEEPEAGIFVYDFGENLSAIPAIKISGPKGAIVRMTPAEQRHGQTDRHNNGTGRVNQAGVGTPNYYEYTLSGSGQESWQPQFTYGGFQYLEISGAVPEGHPNPKNLPVLQELRSVHVRSSVKQVGAFSCSNPLLVKIDECIDRAVRSNLAHVLTDCPTREKLGWLEVSYLMGPSISRRYDLSRLYAKVTRDIRESQGEDGVMYTVAPNYPKFGGGFRYTPEWGAAGVIIPWQLYRWYGDQRVLKENLSAMKAFVDYMKNTSADLVPVAGLGDWYDYGHGKGSGEAKFTPPELSAMATFYRCATIVAETAGALGNKDDEGAYTRLAQDIRSKFNAKFYVGKGEYRNHGSPQTANAMALVTGLCEPANEQAVLAAIVSDLKKRNYQQTAGDVGFHYLVEALSRYNCHETIYRILNRHDEGSYGFIMDRGWTALPEAWDASTGASMNHCMLGHIQQWFYCDVLGIQQADDSTDFKKIIISPATETELEWAKGYYDSVNGRISTEWKKESGQLSLMVMIPANSTALVYVPAKDAAAVTEGGESIDKAQGVKFLRMEGERAVFEIGSGSYNFRSTIPTTAT